MFSLVIEEHTEINKIHIEIQKMKKFKIQLESEHKSKHKHNSQKFILRVTAWLIGWLKVNLCGVVSYSSDSLRL